jgi:hypothetical protein
MGGFDVVAVAETEDSLIEAVSVEEPDAIVVEADLCASLEHVRDLAPEAVVIVVGDHTPAGAIGRIERGVTGTVMAGLLRALVAEGVGAALVWGLVPALREPDARPVLSHVVGALLSAKADLVRAVEAVLRAHGGWVAATSTAAVTISASLLLVLGHPPTYQRTERLPVPAPSEEGDPRQPIVVVSPATRAPARPDPVKDPDVGPRRGAIHGGSMHGGRRDGPRGHRGSPPRGPGTNDASAWRRVGITGPPSTLTTGTGAGGATTPFPTVIRRVAGTTWMGRPRMTGRSYHHPWPTPRPGQVEALDLVHHRSAQVTRPLRREAPDRLGAFLRHWIEASSRRGPWRWSLAFSPPRHGVRLNA